MKVRRPRQMREEGCISAGSLIMYCQRRGDHTSVERLSQAQLAMLCMECNVVAWNAEECCEPLLKLTYYARHTTSSV